MVKIFAKDARGLELTLTNVLVLVIFSLIIFQGIGLMIGSSLGFEIKFGPVFVLLPLLISSIMGLAILKKLLTNVPVSREDVFSIVTTVLIALVVMFFLRDFIPEVFEESIVQLQSVLGI